jgi:hypothetical protein
MFASGVSHKHFAMPVLGQSVSISNWPVLTNQREKVQKRRLENFSNSLFEWFYSRSILISGYKEDLSITSE